MKKLTASFLIAFTLWVTIIAPARAVVPLVAFGFLTGANGLSGSVLGATALATAIMAYEFTNNGQPPDAQRNNTELQIQLDPYTPLITPDTAKPQPVVDPTTNEEDMSDELAFWRGSGECGVSQAYDAPTAFNGTLCGTWTIDGPCEYRDDNTRYVCPIRQGGTTTFGSVSKIGGCIAGDTPDGNSCIRTTTSCPPGYLENSSDGRCYVQNPDETQVADAKSQIERTLNEFRKNPNDPDPLPPNVTMGPKDITITTPDRTTQVRINDDGTLDFKEITPTPDGNTKVEEAKASAPTPGQPPQVIGKGSKTYPGQEAGPNGGPQIPGTNSGTPTSPATPVTVAGGTTLNFDKSGLATDARQCGYDAAHPCKVEGSVKISETGTPESFSNPQLEQLDTAYDDLVTKIQSQTEGVGQGIELPVIGAFSSGECSNPTFDASNVAPGARASIPICEHAAEAQPVLRWAMYIFTALLIWGLWFRRMGGAR